MILEYIVERQQLPVMPMNIAIESYDPKTLYWHVMMLTEGGFIKATPTYVVNTFTNSVTIKHNIKYITWAGYDLLEQLN